jgi:HEAT repeat protein
MSKDESLDSASSEFNLTTYIQSLQFKLRCYEASGDDFQRLFEDIMVRTRPGFMRIRPYGDIGDRKCDGLFRVESRFFQVYSPDELKQAQLKKKIHADLDGAVKHWSDMKEWVFVYNVRRGVPPDIPKILQQKQKQYPNIEIDHLSNDALWTIACELTLQQRAEILGVPVFEELAPLGFKPEKNAVCQFLEDIENDERFKYIGFFHTPQEVVLKEQYIPIQVTLESKRQDVENFWQLVESETELKRAYALKGMDDESRRSQVDWEEAKKQHKRIMVLADPGMGKSTLLKMEAVLTAQVEKQKLLENQITVDEVIFPLFLRLSDLVDEKVEEIFKAEIIDAIPILMQRYYPKAPSGISYLLKEKLKTGKCLLFLDALDEVPREYRNRLKDKLNRFAQTYPCQIICTSRIVGYDGAFVNGAKEVEIVPFKQKQIEQYIKIWFTNAADYIDNDLVSANGLIRELQNKPQIRGLAQNPLLLSLLCSLYQEKELMLPARRCQIYEKAVLCMLSKWTRNRKPQSEGKIRAKIRVLEELAYQFTCEGKEIFSSDELYDKIEEYLQGEKVPTVFRKTDTDELIAELSEEDGILQKLAREGDRYLFLHRTFQEYLTASYLNRTNNSIALAREHFWEYDWHETLSLLAGLMENPIPLLQAITAEKDDIFSTLLLLAGRCVAECEEISHPLITKIIDTVYRAWNFYPDFDLIKSTVVALGQANSQMLERLQEVLDDKNIRVREREAWALGKIRNSQAVEPLIQALKDEDSNVRQYAAWALGEIGSPLALRALIEALSDGHINVRGMAVGALGKIDNPEVVTELISVFNQEECPVRGLVAKALGQIGNPEVLRALISALNREKWTIRACAAEALGEIGNSEAVEPLMDALDDESGEVRWRVAEALGRISSPKAVKALIKAFNDENDDVRYRVAEALEQIGDSQAFEVLFKALKDKNSHVKWHAAQALGQMGSPEVVEALISALDDNDTQVRWYVVLALGKTGSLQAIEALIKVLECDEDSFVKEMAPGALGQIGSLQAVEALISALKDKNSRVRGGAAVALGKIRSSEALEVLIKALHDEEINVRWSAATALGKIGNLQAIEALIKALHEEDETFIKQGLISSLDEIANPTAAEALIKALNDKASQVKTQAAQTLGKIGTLETLEKLIQLPEIDICDPDIFLLARTLTVRFSKEKLPFIPVYPELVAHKQ